MIIITSGFADYGIKQILNDFNQKAIIVSENKNINKLIDICDAIVLTGGEDINPELYNEENEFSTFINVYRDLFELEVLKKAILLNKKVLGICRGHQMINVVLGGTLYQDIYTNGFYHASQHVVEIKGKKWKKLFGGEIVTNSMHHQGIKKLGSGLIPIGHHKYDRLIEAIYHPKLNWLGVQWHPECMNDSEPIWKWLTNN